MNKNTYEFVKFLKTKGFTITEVDENKNPVELTKELKDVNSCFANEIYSLIISFAGKNKVRFECLYTEPVFDISTNGCFTGKIEESYISLFVGSMSTPNIMKAIFYMCFGDILNGMTEYKQLVLSCCNTEGFTNLQRIALEKEPITYLTGLYENEYNKTFTIDDIKETIGLADDDDDDDETPEFDRDEFDDIFGGADIKSMMGFS